MNEPIDVTPDQSNPELLPAKAQPMAIAPADLVTTATPQQRRVLEVSEALAPAYQKASTLEISDEEWQALIAPFPDSAIEIRPHDGLIYIPHIFISNRLNQVFRPGKWAMIRRREWFDQDSSTMYGEYILLIRGCYVGESVGGHPYVARNPKQNYSDVLESTAAEALRRIAGKRLSCGSQVWEPEYCRQWQAKFAEQRNGKWYRKQGIGAAKTPQDAPKTTSPPESRSEASDASTVPVEAAKPAVASAATRAKMIQQLGPAAKDAACRYFIDLGAIMPNEGLEELPLQYVPTTIGEMKALVASIQDHEATGQAREAFPPHKEAFLAPEAPAPTPEPQAEGESVTGVIEQISLKTGTNTKGKPWKRYGIKLGGIWYNTFDTKLGGQAEAAKQDDLSVTLVYKAGDKGNDLLEVRLA